MKDALLLRLNGQIITLTEFAARGGSDTQNVHVCFEFKTKPGWKWSENINNAAASIAAGLSRLYGEGFKVTRAWDVKLKNKDKTTREVCAWVGAEVWCRRADFVASLFKEIKNQLDLESTKKDPCGCDLVDEGEAIKIRLVPPKRAGNKKRRFPRLRVPKGQ